MEKPCITAVHVGASGCFAAVCRRLRVAPSVYNLVPWDEKQWKRSKALKALKEQPGLKVAPGCEMEKTRQMATVSTAGRTLGGKLAPIGDANCDWSVIRPEATP